MCGLSTRIRAHAVPAPVEDDVAQRLPEALPVLRVEVDVVDVLVALGRVLGVLQRPVRPPVEPLRMLARATGGRARSGSRSRARSRARPRSRAATSLSKSFSVPSSGWIASCPPSGPPIAQGLPGSPGAATQRVVAALAVRRPDRVDRRQVDDVEAELGELRQHLLDALEPSPRAREELVPGAEPRPQALDVGLERRRRDLAVPVLRRRASAPRRASRRTRRRRRAPRPRPARRSGRTGRRRPCGRARRAASRSGRPRPRPRTASAPAPPARSSRARGRFRPARAGSPSHFRAPAAR